MFMALEGNHTLGRNESRPARLLDYRDYCKLHIISHFVSVLAGARAAGRPFHVLPIGNVGADVAGDRLRAEMAAAGMDMRFVSRVPDKSTLFSVCFLYPAGSGGNITTSDAAPASLTAGDIGRAEPVLRKYGRRAIALAAPEVPLSLRRHLLELGTQAGAFRVASFTPGEIGEAMASGMLRVADLVSLNEDEAVAIAGVPYGASVSSTGVPSRCAGRTAGFGSS